MNGYRKDGLQMENTSRLEVLCFRTVQPIPSRGCLNIALIDMNLFFFLFYFFFFFLRNFFSVFCFQVDFFSVVFYHLVICTPD